MNKCETRGYKLSNLQRKVEKMYCRVSPSLYQILATERWVLHHAVLFHVTAPKVTYIHVYVQRGHI